MKLLAGLANETNETCFSMLDIPKARKRMEGRVDDNGEMKEATFEDLGVDDDVVRAMHDYGFEKPSETQKMMLPLLLDRTAGNVRLWAQSGTGKAASLLVAFLVELVRWRRELQEAKTFWLCWKNRVRREANAKTDVS